MNEENVIHIYIKEYYSVMKKNEIMLPAEKWMELKNKMLSEIFQTESLVSHGLFYMRNLKYK